MTPQFIFVTCQIGAEKAVKGEIALRWPDFRFAFSRPGFLTFRLPESHSLADDFELDSVFARSYGFSLGKVAVTPEEVDYAKTWEICVNHTFQRIHVWERDREAAGEHGFEPSLTSKAIEVHERILAQCPHPACLAKSAIDPQAPAKLGELVLDVILVEPDLWWVGYHRVRSTASRYPGGLMSLELPSDVVSRAWLKMEEGLRWSELPIPHGARVAEIGSAPGGASQALLSRGLMVTGIDPAEMAPTVLQHPRFTHIRKRSNQVRRREYRKVRWLTADMNVAPSYTLDAIEAIVTHSEVNVRGLLLTLKLPEWQLAAEVPGYLERIRSWGFNIVRARQLQYDRREICVAALQKPFHRKPFKE
jgi:23S rRNA (cytidine2498-2'-O)-methyltransferase